MLSSTPFPAQNLRPGKSAERGVFAVERLTEARDRANNRRMLLVKTVVKNSSIEGLGLFAAADMPADTQVWAYHQDFDKVLTEDKLEEMPEWQKDFFRRYCFSSGDLLYYCIDDARFMNHSEKPNLVDRPEGTFTARPIKAGEELVCDYAGMGHTEKDIAFNTGWFG